jgi:hypothetical protein
MKSSDKQPAIEEIRKHVAKIGADRLDGIEAFQGAAAILHKHKYTLISALVQPSRLNLQTIYGPGIIVSEVQTKKVRGKWQYRTNTEHRDLVGIHKQRGALNGLLWNLMVPDEQEREAVMVSFGANILATIKELAKQESQDDLFTSMYQAGYQLTAIPHYQPTSYWLVEQMLRTIGFSVHAVDVEPSGYQLNHTTTGTIHKVSTDFLGNPIVKVFVQEGLDDASHVQEE